MSPPADPSLQGSFGALIEELAGAPPIPLEASDEILAPGTVVDGSFEIVKKLGAGGMGVVYLARDRRLGRDVALKLMRLDRWRQSRRTELLAVLEREARATAQLHHENVVTLHHVGSWDGSIYLVLEVLRGQTLAERLARGPLSLDEALDVFEQILAGLEHAHSLGIVHRDLKPQNIFVTSAGRVKLLDFGLAGLTRDGESVETPGAALGTFMSRAGTPAYMAPEQWRGEREDARTDLWQAGVTLYELLTGELPHVDAQPRSDARSTRSEGAKAATRSDVRSDARSDARSEARAAADSLARSDAQNSQANTPSFAFDRVPKPLGALLEQLLSRDAAARPTSASEVLVELRAIRHGRSKGSRHRAIVLGAAGLVAIAAIAWFAWPRGAPTMNLAGTWAYAPEGHAGVKLSALGGDRYLFEYTDAQPGEAPSAERFYIKGELTLSHQGDKLVLAGDVVDVPGWGKGQVGAMSFEVLSSDRMSMTRSVWGKTRDNYTFSYPTWLLVRVSGK